MISLGPDEGFVGNARRYGHHRERKNRTRIILSGMIIALLIGMAVVVIYAGSAPANGYGGQYRATADHVVINEVYYDAPTGYSEPQCEWIEIYNPTSSDVDISGWIITDNPSPDGGTEGAWTFPQGTTIPAGGYILVVNDATYKGQFNSLFPGVTPDFDTNTSNSIPDVSKAGSLSLGNSGDDVHLFDSSQTEVDVMWYGSGGNMGSTNAAPDVAAGHSLARYYNAEDTDNPSADFYDETSPTPGAQNPQTIPEITQTLPVAAVALVIILIGWRRRK